MYIKLVIDHFCALIREFGWVESYVFAFIFGIILMWIYSVIISIGINNTTSITTCTMKYMSDLFLLKLIDDKEVDRCIKKIRRVSTLNILIVFVYLIYYSINLSTTTNKLGDQIVLICLYTCLYATAAFGSLYILRLVKTENKGKVIINSMIGIIVAIWGDRILGEKLTVVPIASVVLLSLTVGISYIRVIIMSAFRICKRYRESILKRDSFYKREKLRMIFENRNIEEGKVKAENIIANEKIMTILKKLIIFPKVSDRDYMFNQIKLNVEKMIIYIITTIIFSLSVYGGYRGMLNNIVGVICLSNLIVVFLLDIILGILNMIIALIADIRKVMQKVK